MATITIKSACPIQAPDPDSLNIDLHDDHPWKRTLPLLLVKLGQKLIEHGHHQDPNDCWLSSAQVSMYCRRYNLRWEGGSTRAKGLELTIRVHFEKEGEIRAGGVKIEYNAKWNETHRRNDIYLRFIRLYPDGSSS
jgi:hypothetical protein